VNDLSALEWLARAVSAAAAMLLFGASLFVLYMPRETLGAAGTATLAAGALVARLRRIALGCVVALAVAGVLWLALRAATIAGVPLTGVVASATARAVALDTLFGRVSIVRLALVAVAALLLGIDRRSRAASHVGALDVARAVVAFLLLASLAWTGHAIASAGSQRDIEVASDTLHLVAAGAWLGALLPLAFLLARTAREPGAPLASFAARTTARFSVIGIVCVGALIVTGTINAVFLVGRPAELFGTRYGQLLLAKLALFAAMVALAAGNRRRFNRVSASAAQPDAGRDPAIAAAFRRIARHATYETTLGLGIAGIVGALGASVPAMHAPIAWPLPFTLDWDVTAPATHWRLLALLAAAFVAAAFALVSPRSWRFARAGLVAASVIALAAACALVAVPALPTTYARVPIPYAVPSIGRGAALYAAHCAVCHGAEGRGDGPAAASLPVRPDNLVAGHGAAHPPGELYWYVSHGIPGSPMPAFAAHLSERERWDVINFLRARVSAERARALTPTVRLGPLVVAPDFAFELEPGVQHTLREGRDRSLTLLVLYTLPASVTRLAALASVRGELERSGVRVVALPLGDAEATDSTVDRVLLARAEPAFGATYAMIVQAFDSDSDPDQTRHAELLIDRQGYIRARWLGSAGVPSMAELARAGQSADALPLPDPATLHSH